MTAPVVVLEHAAAVAGDRMLWADVDLNLEPGQLVAVLGPNGVGKSTLVKVLLGRHPLAAGTAEVLGRPPGQVRDEVGYLPQRRGFDDTIRLRGRDLVRLGWDGHRYGVTLSPSRRREAARRVQHAIEDVGATSYADRVIGRLSGGEQQRLLIAQALVRRPQLLLLDEPLDSLDLPNQAAVAALLGRLCHDLGITVLVVAHDVNPLLPFLDHVVYLGGGRAAVGTPAEVVTSETLTGLYGTPVDVLHASDGRLVVVGQPEPLAMHADRHAHVGHAHP